MFFRNGGQCSVVRSDVSRDSLIVSGSQKEYLPQSRVFATCLTINNYYSLKFFWCQHSEFTWWMQFAWNSSGKYTVWLIFCLNLKIEILKIEYGFNQEQVPFKVLWSSTQNYLQSYYISPTACECPGFSVIDEGDRPSHLDCQARCEKRNETSAIPFSREGYECLLRKAGGKAVPLWTGIRFRHDGLWYGSLRRTESEGFYGTWIPTKTYGALLSNGSDRHTTNFRCIYFHSGIYRVANCLFRHPSGDRIRCACAKRKSNDQWNPEILQHSLTTKWPATKSLQRWKQKTDVSVRNDRYLGTRILQWFESSAHYRIDSHEPKEKIENVSPR